MKFKLEELAYQQAAIESVLRVFAGQEKNTFENSRFFDIQTNVCDLPREEINANKKTVLLANGLTEDQCNLCDDNDYCIEMETGTGKTLVYIRTIYELFKHFGLTKFIIFVPSVAIREGVLQTLKDFEEQLKDIYGRKIDYFEYDSKKLNRLHHYITDTQPQIMVMTIQSFTSDDRIINQEGRDDAFEGMSYFKALGKCQPVIIMDEPQEGMDTENAVERIKDLNPLCKLRYSATHKLLKNLIHRLTPYDAYNQGLVKKIEVLTVSERNDEATLKLEFSRVQMHPKNPPKAKLNLWKNTASGFKWAETAWLKDGDNLADKSGNITYRDYTVDRIYKGLSDRAFKVKFTNGVELRHEERDIDPSLIFREQLKYLIMRHFEKRETLRQRGIKCLSLIFIDRVDNYLSDDGIIKTLFAEEYSKHVEAQRGQKPTAGEVAAVQGFYFAKTTSGEYTDSTASMRTNREIYDLILKAKETLLSLEEPIEFIFSHSALGVGWDNPNIFNIATLNQSYSEIKKRQEIGRGLRICVNQSGQRNYDPENVKEGDEINLLTIVPNETYETFALQYQEQIREVYGDTDAGSRMRHTHKGDKKGKNKVRRNPRFKDGDMASEWEKLWDRLSRKTDFKVAFNEPEMIQACIKSLNGITVQEYSVDIALTRIHQIYADGMDDEIIGSEVERVKGCFSPLDFIEELSENTSLSYSATVEIIRGITNYKEMIKNPPRFLQEATAKIKTAEMEFMLRGLTYFETADRHEQIADFIETYREIVPTKNKGIYDAAICDSGSKPERDFAKFADEDSEVVCFLKLPDAYKIPIPGGQTYTPDFGLMLKRRGLREGNTAEFYFVIETKGTNSLEDTAALTGSEIFKIRCAQKHFAALGIDATVDYKVPVQEYKRDFKNTL